MSYYSLNLKTLKFISSDNACQFAAFLGNENPGKEELLIFPWGHETDSEIYWITKLKTFRKRNFRISKKYVSRKIPLYSHVILVSETHQSSKKKLISLASIYLYSLIVYYFIKCTLFSKWERSIFRRYFVSFGDLLIYKEYR